MSTTDVMCIYCPDTDKCYYIKRKEFGKSVSLRLGECRQNERIHFAENFENF